MLTHCKKLLIIKNLTNLGYPGGMNQGLKAADTKYVLLSNNDITFYPQTINELLKAIRGLEYWYVTAIDKKRNWSKVEKLLQNNQLIWEGLCCSCFIARKELFEQVGLFDENLFPGHYDDIDFGYRASKLGYAARAYIPAVIEHCHAFTSKKYNFNSGEVLSRNKKYVEEKHGIKLGW